MSRKSNKEVAGEEIAIESGNSRMEVSFSLGRQKSAVIAGHYDNEKTPIGERIKFWEIIQHFGIELVQELDENHVEITRLIFCEVDPGMIVFEIETDSTAAVRKKAILAVQEKFDAAIEEAIATGFDDESMCVPVSGPGDLQ